MVLNNAERQARHRQRLKEAAEATTFVRIVEGTIDNDAVVHDTRMRAIPRVGETIRLRLPSRQELRYRVLAVEHLFDLREGAEIVNDHTGVQVSVERA